MSDGHNHLVMNTKMAMKLIVCVAMLPLLVFEVINPILLSSPLINPFIYVQNIKVLHKSMKLFDVFHYWSDMMYA